MLSRADPASERTDDWSDPEKNGPTLDRTKKSNVRDAPDGGRATAHSSDREHSESLRSKLVLALACLLAVVAGIDEVVRQKVIAPEFSNLERLAAIQDANRVLSALNMDLEYMTKLARLGANEFSRNPLQDTSELTRLEWIGALSDRDHRDAAALVAPDGTWTWLMTQQVVDDQQFRDLTAHLTSLSKEPQHNRRGVTAAGDGSIYLFAGATQSHETGSATPTDYAGRSASTPTFVLLRALDRDFIESVVRRTSVPFTVEPISPNRPALSGIEIRTPSDDQVLVTSPLSSPAGKPVGTIVVDLPREITSRTKQTTAFARRPVDYGRLCCFVRVAVSAAANCDWAIGGNPRAYRTNC